MLYNVMTALFGPHHHLPALEIDMVIGCSDGHLPWPVSSMSSPPPVSPYLFLMSSAGLSNCMLKRKRSMGISRQSDLLQVQTVEEDILCASGALVWTQHTNINSSVNLPVQLFLHPFLISPVFSEILQ